MSAELILAIDQGTTSSRAIVFDANGTELGIAQQEISLQFPQSGWVNQDPRDLRDVTLSVAADVLRQINITWSDLTAIGITNQRETTLLWDRSTGEPVTEAIVWQSRQSADVIRAWERAGHRERVHVITGLVMDAYFSASKIRWLLDRDPDLASRAKRGEICFGTVDSWLIWHLTGGAHFTDTTNASRTMLFDITRQMWSDELLECFGIPKAILPEIVTSSGGAIQTSQTFGSVPVSGIAGDQHASLFGHMCFTPGMAKCTYGTGTFVVMNTGDTPALSQSGLLT
ncbi:MAG TPA: FGGY family carbohydrate kinase, partial [Thermomicrobiales bacterium]|nr:FGGY family carbohydrate kinase [Thermomicrobiales bacterium]